MIQATRTDMESTTMQTGVSAPVPRELKRAFQVGWRLVFAAGFIPGSAGLAMLLLALWSATAGSSGGWIS